MTRDRIEAALAAFVRATRDVLLGAATIGFVLLAGSLTCNAVSTSCSKADRARGIDLPALADGIETYWAKTGRLPEQLDDLVVAGIVDRLFDDPWGRPYRYERGVTDVRLSSLGKDGKLGGVGNDADLECWLRVSDTVAQLGAGVALRGPLNDLEVTRLSAPSVPVRSISDVPFYPSCRRLP